MGIKVETRGFPELERQLKGVGNEVAQAKTLGSALRTAMRPVLNAAKDLVPVDTGNLRESIKLRIYKPRSGLPTAAAVGVWWSQKARGVAALVQPFYALFVEKGTRHSLANAFLRPAFDSDVEGMTNRLRVALGAAIDRAVKRNG